MCIRIPGTYILMSSAFGKPETHGRVRPFSVLRFPPAFADHSGSLSFLSPTYTFDEDTCSEINQYHRIDTWLKCRHIPKICYLDFFSFNATAKKCSDPSILFWEVHAVLTETRYLAKFEKPVILSYKSLITKFKNFNHVLMEVMEA